MALQLGKFGLVSPQDVDWDATDGFMQSLSEKRVKWHVKHAHGMCGVGKIMQCYKQWLTLDCLYCGAVEDTKHLWLCPSEQVTTLWTKHLNALSQWCEEHHTAPSLTALLLNGLSSWCNGSNPASHPDIGSLRDFQTVLGWQLLFEGRPTMGWQSIQQRHYSSLSCWNTGKR